jgi:hypothetical protein
MKTVLTNLVAMMLILVLTGCATIKKALVVEKAPTIAHVHIGHTITGWKHSPGQKGLFQVAEQEADIALAHAGYAIERPDRLDLIQLHATHVMHAIDPESQKQGPGTGFGLKQALTEAVGHVTYAAESDDASQNIINFARPFTENAEDVLERSNLILALGEEILQDISVQEAFALAEEMLILASANVEGIDKDGDGSVSVKPDEYGIKQLRYQITEMIAREDPPYVPVSKRYLFGLIRLPSGKWDFSWRVNRPQNSGYGKGGGGY